MEGFPYLGNIADVPWLQKPHIHMKNPEEVIKKLNCISRDGSNMLQVIFDFDRTLTKHHENGIPTKSSFGVLEMLPFVPEGFTMKMKENLEKYLPIETDPGLTVEEKIPYMLEWWMSGINMLVGLQWDPVEIDEFLRKNEQPFRDGTRECLEALEKANVPVLVFSAGVGDVVKPCLEHQGFLTSNVHVVSNFLKFHDGKVAGSLGNIIHVFNKNETVLKDSVYFEKVAGRRNVILLGDSVGDAKMADGITHDIVLKIGFLNTHVEKSLPLYKDLFDIVLVDDQSMDVLQNILRLSLC